MKTLLKEIFRVYNWPLRRFFINKEKSYPTFKLTDKHLQNCKVIASRNVLLKNLSKNGNIAEIGVDTGSFSKEILEIANPEKLVLIDSWNSKRYNATKKIQVENHFQKELESGQIDIKISNSIKAAGLFENNFFDWIYIDTDHSYETTKAELLSYAPKVKTGGVIAGHDYCQGTWTNLVRYGVIEAVNEFCVKENWELIFLTAETNFPPSFAIRRIQ